MTWIIFVWFYHPINYSNIIDIKVYRATYYLTCSAYTMHTVDVQAHSFPLPVQIIGNLSSLLI